MLTDRLVVLVNEQVDLIEWTLSNYNSFYNLKKDNPNINFYSSCLDYYSDTNDHCNAYPEYYRIKQTDSNDKIVDIFKKIRDRIIIAENLQKYQSSTTNPDFIYCMFHGSSLHLHTDTPKHDTEKVLIRFNVCIQKPDRGGNPIYANNLIELKERQYIICRSGLDYHTSEVILGDKPKISLSYGFLIDKDDIHLFTDRETVQVLHNNSINTWRINSDNMDELANKTCKLTPDNVYTLNINNTLYDELELFVYETTLFHLKKRDILFDGNRHIITFTLLTDQSKFIVDYNKINNATPILNTITYLSEDAHSLIFTNVDVDEYMYKDISDKNTITISVPQRNSQIVFDGSKYYGFCKKDTCGSSAYLKISVWEEQSTNSNLYINDGNITNNHSYSLITNNNCISETMVKSYSILERILYEHALEEHAKFSSLICNSANVNTIFVFDILDEELSIDMLQTKYKHLTTDILPFLPSYPDLNIENDSRFKRMRIIKNLITYDICYWIINECEKKNDWVKSKYKNYCCVKYLECMPSVLNFILFALNFWLNSIKKQFDIVSLDCSIKDVFVSKCSSFHTDDNFNVDGSLLICNLLLNNVADYKGGGIVFEDEENDLNLLQGDMLIYNGKKGRKSDRVTEGDKYILVIVIEISAL
jgi:hypothetical protein